MVPQRPARHLRSDRIGMIAWALGLAVLLIIVFSLLRNRGQAANSEESPAAANHKKINPAMRSPEEVRRALVPSETEREALRRQELDRAAAEKQDFLAREPVLDTKDT